MFLNPEDEINRNWKSSESFVLLVLWTPQGSDTSLLLGDTAFSAF